MVVQTETVRIRLELNIILILMNNDTISEAFTFVNLRFSFVLFLLVESRLLLTTMFDLLDKAGEVMPRYQVLPHLSLGIKAAVTFGTLHLRRTAGTTNDRTLSTHARLDELRRHLGRWLARRCGGRSHVLRSQEVRRLGRGLLRFLLPGGRPGERCPTFRRKLHLRRRKNLTVKEATSVQLAGS